MNKDARRVTNDVISAVEDGFLDWESVARACLDYMSEDDVAGMAIANDWAIASDDELYGDIDDVDDETIEDKFTTAELELVNEIADRYVTSSPVSGKWETEAIHERDAIAKELNITKEEADEIMIEYLGFDAEALQPEEYPIEEDFEEEELAEKKVTAQEVINAAKKYGLTFTKEALEDLEWNIVDYINDSEFNSADEWMKAVIDGKTEELSDLFEQDVNWKKIFNESITENFDIEIDEKEALNRFKKGEVLFINNNDGYTAIVPRNKLNHEKAYISIDYDLGQKLIDRYDLKLLDREGPDYNQEIYVYKRRFNEGKNLTLGIKERIAEEFVSKLSKEALAAIDEVADIYNTSSPISGKWETEAIHERDTLVRELGYSIKEANQIMIDYLGFDPSIDSSFSFLKENENKYKILESEIEGEEEDDGTLLNTDYDKLNFHDEGFLIGEMELHYPEVDVFNVFDNEISVDIDLPINVEPEFLLQYICDRNYIDREDLTVVEAQKFIDNIARMPDNYKDYLFDFYYEQAEIKAFKEADSEPDYFNGRRYTETKENLDELESMLEQNDSEIDFYDGYLTGDVELYYDDLEIAGAQIPSMDPYEPPEFKEHIINYTYVADVDEDELVEYVLDNFNLDSDISNNVLQHYIDLVESSKEELDKYFEYLKNRYIENAREAGELWYAEQQPFSYNYEED